MGRMPLPVFELACVVIVVATLLAMARTRPVGELSLEYSSLAIAAWIGEETCVVLYGHYHYAPHWIGRLDRVPLLVPLIWPLVVLSARDVSRALFSEARRAMPLVVLLVVAFDASLVEVIAVRAGLWHWSEPGHLGVPVIGIHGWGFFAAGADLALSRKRHRWMAIVVAPLVAHALILGTWWGLFRWTLRRDLGLGSLAFVAAFGAFALSMVVRARRRGLSIPLAVAAPRMIAAALFVALLMATAPRDAPLWIHTLAVAVPYLAATRLSSAGRRSAGAPV
jgi:hypothetical protein